MNGETEDFCFESDVKDIKIVKSEGDIEAQIHDQEVVKSDSNESVCYICNQKFPTFELELHYLDCVNEENTNEPQTNISCVEVTSDDQSLEDIFKFKCQTCFKSYKSRKTLDNHLKKCKRKRPKIIKLEQRCKVCNETFGSELKLKRHKKTHTDKKAFKCSKCDKSFVNQHQLKKHFHYGSNVSVKGLNFTICETLEDKAYICFICQESLVCLKALSRHLESHNQRNFTTDTSQSLTKNPLEVCVSEKSSLQGFEGEDVIQSHKDPLSEPKIDLTPSISDVISHSQQREEIISNPSFSSAVTYIRNETVLKTTKTYSKSRNLGYICTLCGKHNETSQDLRFHLKSHNQQRNNNASLTTSHQPSQPYKPITNFKCGICVKSFSDLETMNLHLKTIHYGNAHKCNFCQDSFNSFISLELHERLKHLSYHLKK